MKTELFGYIVKDTEYLPRLLGSAAKQLQIYDISLYELQLKNFNEGEEELKQYFVLIDGFVKREDKDRKFKLAKFHFKRGTNTIYTINALNKLNNDNLNFEDYKNNLLVVRRDVLKIYELLFVKKQNYNPANFFRPAATTQ